MSGISRPPFRLLMQLLGAGGSVSEFVSAEGIIQGNKRTRQMLTIDPRERHTGIQLFGGKALAMAQAAQRAEDYGPSFIDINMGCPVKKVVTKGGGAALLREEKKLGAFLGTIRKAIRLPLTIKIRTGWDETSRNARDIIRIAASEGISSVTIHGRTRAQQYRGLADWGYMENLALSTPLPLVGNGDLSTPMAINNRLKVTNLSALMLARGPLRNPFLFLESLCPTNPPALFDSSDYLEVIHTFNELHNGDSPLSLKKHIVWFSSCLEGSALFRRHIFKAKTLREILSLCDSFFSSLTPEDLASKHNTAQGEFMAGGHG